LFVDYDKQHKSVSRRRRCFSLMVSIIVAVLGLYSKYYAGPAAAWVIKSLGGVFYVIFWCQVIHLIRPDFSPLPVSIIVVIITCAIEFTQLSQADTLEYIRRTFAGRALIGHSFNPLDFPYYIAGGFIAWALQYYNRITNKSDEQKEIV